MADQVKETDKKTADQSASTEKQSSAGTPAPQTKRPFISWPKFQAKAPLSLTGLVQPDIWLDSIGGRAFVGVKKSVSSVKVTGMVGVTGNISLDGSEQRPSESGRSAAAIEASRDILQIAGRTVNGFAGAAFGDTFSVRRVGSAIDKPNEVNGFMGVRTSPLLTKSFGIDAKGLGHLELGPQNVRADFIAATSGDSHTVSARVKSTVAESSRWGSLTARFEWRHADGRGNDYSVSTGYDFPQTFTDKWKNKIGSIFKAPDIDPSNPAPEPGLVTRVGRKIGGIFGKREVEHKD